MKEKVTMTRSDLIEIIQTAIRVSGTQPGSKKQCEPEYISQNEAWKRFGRPNVERWINTGLLTYNDMQRKGTTKNSKKYYNLSKLEALKELEKVNLMTIITH